MTGTNYKVRTGIVKTQDSAGQIKKHKNCTFGLGITCERRLAERSSSTCSENPVPAHHSKKKKRMAPLLKKRKP